MKKYALLEIPLYISLDAISFGAKNVTTLLGRSLRVPPSKVKVLEPVEDTNELALLEPIHPYKMQTIFEIWKLYLDYCKDDTNEAYIVISANYKTSGYGKGTWENLQYEGFYTTIEEAENEIDGYLKQ